MSNDTIFSAIIEESIKRLVTVRDTLNDDGLIDFSGEVDDVVRLLGVIKLRKANERGMKQ